MLIMLFKLLLFFKKPGFDGKKKMHSDEHYSLIFFDMIDPGGIANWSVIIGDWSERKWLPKSYSAQDVSNEWLSKSYRAQGVADELLKYIKNEESAQTLDYGSIRHLCYLYARKLYPQTLDMSFSIFCLFLFFGRIDGLFLVPSLHLGFTYRLYIL